MKKLYRFLALVANACVMIVMVACGGDDKVPGNTENLPTTLSEKFDNGIPSDWTNIDADGDGRAWQDYILDVAGNHISLDGQVCSGSYLNSIGALEPDNYLITPKLYIKAGATLSYDVAPFDTIYYPDHYAVLVGTIEDGVFNPVGTLVEEDCSQAAVTRTVSLNEYKGQSLNIAFRHYNCTDVYVMTLDNVTVGTGAKAHVATEPQKLQNTNKEK